MVGLSYALVQGAYLTVFGYLLDQRGFRWRWFLPLAATTILFSAVLIAGMSIPGIPVPDTTSGRVFLFVFEMVGLLVLYPLHALISSCFLKHVRREESWSTRLVLRVIIHLASLCIASWLVVMVVFTVALLAVLFFP